MDSSLLLEAALNNASIPHQPYVLISDEPTFGGVPLMREMISRSSARQSPILLISVLRPASTYLPKTLSFNSSLESIDLTDRIPGYSETDLAGVTAEILGAAQNLGPGGEIYIDAIDVFAEDYTSAGALALVRGLLKQIKANKARLPLDPARPISAGIITDPAAPSRLNLLLSPHSALYPSLLPPSLSASLTQLHPHSLPLLTALSTAYLAPISAEPRFSDLLDMASERRLGERMAWLGESSLGDWASGSSRARQGSSSSAKGKGRSMGDEAIGVAAVRVVVRKATGGAKGMSRSLEGLVLSAASPSAGIASSSTSPPQLVVRPIDSFMDLQPFSHPTPPTNHSQTSSADPRPAQSAASATHTALNLPFNLSLTDEQRRRRDRVPIPYVHEGEGVELGWEDEEEDEDDEEI